MSEIARKKPSCADIEALPESKIGEIVGGELFVSPRPASRQTLANSVLGGELGRTFQLGRGGPGGWWILDYPELHLGYDVLVPDLAGWRRERMPEFPDVGFFTLAPDWICETLSPSTARLDRGRKLPVYARLGVSHAWIVDPLNRAVETFARDGERWVLEASFADDERLCAAPFEGVEIALRTLWTGRA